MTAQHLAAMLARRGYHVIPSPEPWNDGTHITVKTGYGQCTFGWDADFTVQETARLINMMLGDGMHHVQCAQCGYPLLQGVGGTGTGAGATHWYVYRNTQAGPQSAEITRCPRCGAACSEGNVQEIDESKGDEQDTGESHANISR